MRLNQAGLNDVSWSKAETSEEAHKLYDQELEGLSTLMELVRAQDLALLQILDAEVLTLQLPPPLLSPLLAHPL